MLTVYGLKTCDTCRKARKWLDEKGLAHRFVDVRDDGVGQKTLAGWISTFGTDAVVNRRSTTWRELPATAREGLTASNAARLLAAHPTLIKRPVFEDGRPIAIGFTEQAKKALAAR